MCCCLDEPTNDIDVGTLRAIGGGHHELCGLRGGHIARPLVLGQDLHAHPGVRRRQPGGLVRGHIYSEYEANRKERLGDAGPKRIKYRKLVR